MASGHENSEDPVTSVSEEMIYVAVGTDVKDCKSILLWALRNFGGKRICIVHVHRPARWIPNGLGGNHPVSSLDERIVRDYRKAEGKIMNEILEEYLSICHREGVQAQRVWIEMDDIGKGIIELISRDGIKELVMGGALDKHYKEKMSLRSKKAKYVCKRAPLSCRILFICNSRLIYTREEKASSDTKNGQAKHLIPRSITWEHDRDNTESGASNHSRSNSVNLGHNGDITKAVPSNCLRSNSVTLGNERENGGKRMMDFLINESIEECSSPKNKLDVVVEGIGNFDEWDGSIISPGSACPSFPPKKVDDLTLALWNANGLDLSPISSASTNSASPSASSLLQPSPTLTSSASTTSIYSSIGSRSAVDVSLYEKLLLQVIEDAGTEAQMRRQAQRELLETTRMVRALSQLRHPNLVRLIGCCLETFTLIYEYLPNGSLEDWLNCKNKSPPLPWQTRIRIAIELCSVLVYLHSRKPHSIVHGDLKPSNILLDANFVSKLSDFGICRILCHERSSGNDTTLCHLTQPMGTVPYMDPEFLVSGKLTRKSDVYSFGLILLQLLTGQRPDLTIAMEMQVVIDTENLSSRLDPLAGDWPIEIAQNMAQLALKCCDKYRKNRPVLGSDHVKSLLEPMLVVQGFEETHGLVGMTLHAE